MKRIKLVTAYDGTNYHGSQIQNNGETIEGVLKRELSSLLKEEINLIGASRTDAYAKDPEIATALTEYNVQQAALAEAFGADAYRATSKREFKSAFEKALKCGGPVLIDAIIDNTIPFFRALSILFVFSYTYNISRIVP